MSSLRRTLASRANGAKSTGPSTPEGKARSASNSLRHGLLAKCSARTHLILAAESSSGFEEVMNQHLDLIQPADAVEAGLVEEMVAAHWRLRRSWAIETRLLQTASDAQRANQTAAAPIEALARGFESLAGAPALAILHRYEARLHLTYQRTLRTLLLLRTLELPNEP